VRTTAFAGFRKTLYEVIFSDTVNTGIYILEQKFLNICQPIKTDFSKDLFPCCSKDEPMYGYAQGYWCDVGHLDAYREAQYDGFIR